MKYIRELREGAPKSFKTGAVVGSYPKPMLVFLWDRAGLDVVPSSKVIVPPTEFQFDVRYEEIKFLQPGQLASMLNVPLAEQPKILAISYADAKPGELDLLLKPIADSTPFQQFILNDFNAVVRHLQAGRALPWKTVVKDSLSGYQDVLLSHIAAFNPNALADARQWAAQIGAKIVQTISALTSWPCHVVVTSHVTVEKQENTQMVKELPDMYSANRYNIGRLFSQMFYATKNGTRPVLWPHDQMYVVGTGARWPVGLDKVIDPPSFQAIYGKEVGLL